MRTDSRSAAREKAEMFWDGQVAGWEAALAGKDGDAAKHFEAAQRIVKSKGFRYVFIEELSSAPIEDLLTRMEAIEVTHGRPNPQQAAALLGIVPKPSILLTEAMELYFGFMKSHKKLRGKSADQLRKWRNPIIRAVNRFIELIGDLELSAITRDHMLEFRDYWERRIEEESAKEGTANKDFIHLSKVIKEINSKKRLGLPVNELLNDLSFSEGEQAPRPAFSDDFIRNTLLATSALSGLNAQARTIFLVMINTGARPSEIANLSSDRIVLTGDFPHIKIMPDGCQLKSSRAERDIPLAGVSLEAMREFPDGFPQYRESSSSLSATVNKFLRANDLVESDKHTMYSLRHALMNRMIVNKVDDRVRRDIMGHSVLGENYGDGGGFEFKAEVMSAFAI